MRSQPWERGPVGRAGQSVLASERESLLSGWIKPSSVNEQERQERAIRMVRQAIDSHPAFDGQRSSIRVYTKGSYRNNTNVRADSDVDVVVENTACFYYDYGSGVTGPPPGSISPYSGSWTPATWRAEVAAALRSAFGAGVDTSGKVAIYVPPVPGSRPSADVVPSFTFHRYWSADHSRKSVGCCVFDTSSTKIVNWPQQQLDNGIAKNNVTGQRYKNFVRALKNAENVLSKAGTIKPLPSYFMECLVYNVPNEHLVPRGLSVGFRSTLAYLFNNLHTDGAVSEWLEPNEHKYLFRGSQKWTRADGFALVDATWDYLGYE
jgi:hypothetical protein